MTVVPRSLVALQTVQDTEAATLKLDNVLALGDGSVMTVVPRSLIALQTVQEMEAVTLKPDNVLAMKTG